MTANGFASRAGAWPRRGDVPVNAGHVRTKKIHSVWLGRGDRQLFLLLTSFVVSVSISGLVAYANQLIPVPTVVIRAIDMAVSLGVTTLLFGMIFKVQHPSSRFAPA